MHTALVISLFLCVCVNCETINLGKESLFLRNAYPFWEPEVHVVKAQFGNGLLLTPLIKAGKVAEARKKSAVDSQLLDGKTVSYSGFLTVDKTYNSNLFFWFFPTASDNPEAPLILWLQGGPGASSLYGLFIENGPFSVRQHGKHNFTLHDNPYSWHLNYSLLYLDNPVGTGFSFTDSDEGYATNVSTVAQHLHEAMLQFFTVFPELRHNDFYIAGESYAGKYVPALAHKIHNENEEAEERINLKGIAVGNGFTDPVSMLNYSDFAYQVGLVDRHVKRAMYNLENKCRAAIQEGRHLEAYYEWVSLLGILSSTSRLGRLYNFLADNDLHDTHGPYASYVQSTAIRLALHVGNVEYTSIGRVYHKMLPDFMNSAKPQVEELLDAGYRVMFYSGQLDIIVAYPLSVNLYNSLDFDHAEEYNRAQRKPWYLDDGKLAGYVKKAGNFVEVMVRNAGHMVPADQPEAALQLIHNFVNDEWEKVDEDEPPVSLAE